MIVSSVNIVSAIRRFPQSWDQRSLKDTLAQAVSVNLHRSQIAARGTAWIPAGTRIFLRFRYERAYSTRLRSAMRAGNV